MDEILSLLSLPMSIHPEHFNSLKLALYTALSNGSTGALSDNLKRDEVRTHIFLTADNRVVDARSLAGGDIPDDSVAIIVMDGIVYPWKTRDIELQLKEAMNHPGIIGIVFYVNTPGGYIHRVDILSDMIRNCEKPTATCVTGMCASAGVWMFSGSDRIFYNSPLDMLGSIGVMTNFSSWKEYWEKEGIVDVDIYASLSTKKNEETREAEGGNYEPIIGQLDYINSLFHQVVLSNLRVSGADSEVLTGKTYFAEEAQRLGLADERGDLERSVNWVVGEAMKRRANAYY